MSARRLETSSSEAASTDSSWVSSRLSMREPARSARSDTGRESAFFKSSAASWVMRSFYPERVRWKQEQNNPHPRKKKAVGINLSPCPHPSFAPFASRMVVRDECVGGWARFGRSDELGAYPCGFVYARAGLLAVL